MPPEQNLNPNQSQENINPSPQSQQTSSVNTQMASDTQVEKAKKTLRIGLFLAIGPILFFIFMLIIFALVNNYAFFHSASIKSIFNVLLILSGVAGTILPFIGFVIIIMGTVKLARAKKL